MTLTTRLGEIPSQVETTVANGTLFRARIVLSVVISHHYCINLPSIGQGFTTGRSDEETDTFEEEATPIAQLLACLVSPEAMLQAQEDDKK
jgi:hypothetical protein